MCIAGYCLRFSFKGSTGGEKKQRKAKNGVVLNLAEWMTNITEWTGMRYEELVRLAQDRGAMEYHDSQPSQRRRHLIMMI